VLPNVFTRLVKRIQRVIIAATYSRVVGNDLGFIGTQAARLSFFESSWFMATTLFLKIALND
jgi:hypothetical protein